MAVAGAAGSNVLDVWSKGGMPIGESKHAMKERGESWLIH